METTRTVNAKQSSGNGTIKRILFFVGILLIERGTERKIERKEIKMKHVLLLICSGRYHTINNDETAVVAFIYQGHWNVKCFFVS